LKAIIYGHSHAYHYDSEYDIHLINIPLSATTSPIPNLSAGLEAVFHADTEVQTARIRR